MQPIPIPATEVFRFPLAMPLFAVVVCIVCTTIGILFARDRDSEFRRFGFGLLFGALIAGLITPLMLKDRITVSPQEINATAGFWFGSKPKGFAYRDVHHVRVTTVRDIRGRTYPAWEVHFRDGKTHVIELGNLWADYSEPIMALLRGYGVVFSN